MALVEALSAFALMFLIWFWALNKNKPVTTNWPLLGMLPNLLRNASRIHEYATEKMHESKYTVMLEGPSYNILVTCDPRNIHHVFSTNFGNYDRGQQFKEASEWLGDGLIPADGDAWKSQRKLTQSLFKKENFLRLVEKNMQEKVKDGLCEVLNHMSDLGKEVDLQDLFLRLMFDVTCNSVLGSDIKSLSPHLPEVPISSAIHEAEEIILMRLIKPRCLWKFQRWLQVGSEKNSKKIMEIIDEFIHTQLTRMRSMNNLRAKQEQAGRGGLDFISSLLLDDETSSPQVSDKFLRDLTLSLVSAGKDTSAVGLTWFFWLLSENPSVEYKIIHEIKTSFNLEIGEKWNFPSFQDLNKVVYLHASLCEAIRLYPPIPLNIRSSIKSDILPTGHHIGQNSRVAFAIYAMGRSKEIWGEDSHIFRPERWITDNGKSIVQIPSYKYNVFGAGPRTCVGKDIVFIGMKIVAAAVLWNYRFEMAKDGPAVPVNSILLHMKDGLNVKVAKKC